MIEAAKLKKWIKILFSEHENKFKRFSVPIPQPFEKIKQEIESLSKDIFKNLVNSLEIKMLMAAYKNQCHKPEPPVEKTKPICKKPKKSFQPCKQSPPRISRLRSKRIQNSTSENFDTSNFMENWPTPPMIAW